MLIGNAQVDFVAGWLHLAGGRLPLSRNFEWNPACQATLARSGEGLINDIAFRTVVNNRPAHALDGLLSAVLGGFVVLADELQAALKSPRKSGINIVAIHHHMIGDEPRMIFFHY